MQLRRLVALVAVVTLIPAVQVVTWSVGQAQAEVSAACPIEGCGGGGDPVHTHTAQLTVARSAGVVTSNSVDGHAISCGATCTVSDSQATEDTDWPTEGWPTYTLTAAGGPSGYAAQWSGAVGCGVAPTCQVPNDQPTRTVTLSWRDTTAPTVGFAPPARVGSAGQVSATGSDNSGSVAAYGWLVDGVVQVTTGASLSLASAGHGDHEVAVRALDAAGNASGFVTKVVTVDRSISLVVSPVPAVVETAPVLTFSTDDDVVERTCRIDAGIFVACTSPWAPALGDGVHTLEVRVRDDLDNVATASRTFVLSTPVPAPTPVEPEPAPAPTSGAPVPPPTVPAAAVAPRAQLQGPARVAAGRRARFSVVVSAPTGVVTWTVDGKQVCRTALRDGRASCRTGRLRPGRHVVAATYAGPAGVGAVVVRRAIVVRR